MGNDVRGAGAGRHPVNEIAAVGKDCEFMQIYVVREGDSLDSIAAAFAVSAEEIAYDNQIPEPYRLALGQALLIPAEGRDSRSGRFASTAMHIHISVMTYSPKHCHT